MARCPLDRGPSRMTTAQVERGALREIRSAPRRSPPINPSTSFATGAIASAPQNLSYLARLTIAHRSWSRVLGSGAPVIALAAAFAMTACSSQAPITLRLRSKVGDRSTYTLQMRITEPGAASNGGAFTSTIAYQEECVSANDKQVVSKLTFTKAESNQPGGAAMAEMLKGQSTLVTYDTRGRVLGTQGGQAVVLSNSPNSSIVLPEQPIRPGDQWEETMTNQGRSLKIAYRFEKLESLDGRKVAFIYANVKEDPEVRNEGPMKIWVDVDTGRVDKSEAKLIGRSQGREFVVDVTLSRS